VLAADRVVWAGRLDEVAFLRRIWDLSRGRSTDSRFKDAAGDIYQHRIYNPTDRDDDWIFSDSRFDVAHTDDQRFLEFLCQTVHPVVRPDGDEARELVEVYNAYLGKDGVHLVAVDQPAGRSRYEPRTRSRAVEPAAALPSIAIRDSPIPTFCSVSFAGSSTVSMMIPRRRSAPAKNSWSRSVGSFSPTTTKLRPTAPICPSSTSRRRRRCGSPWMTSREAPRAPKQPR
jgi:hypothetical protein